MGAKSTKPNPVLNQNQNQNQNPIVRKSSFSNNPNDNSHLDNTIENININANVNANDNPNANVNNITTITNINTNKAHQENQHHPQQPIQQENLNLKQSKINLLRQSQLQSSSQIQNTILNEEQDKDTNQKKLRKAFAQQEDQDSLNRMRQSGYGHGHGDGPTNSRAKIKQKPISKAARYNNKKKAQNQSQSQRKVRKDMAKIRNNKNPQHANIISNTNIDRQVYKQKHNQMELQLQSSSSSQIQIHQNQGNQYEGEGEAYNEDYQDEDEDYQDGNEDYVDQEGEAYEEDEDEGYEYEYEYNDGEDYFQQMLSENNNQQLLQQQQGILPLLPLKDIILNDIAQLQYRQSKSKNTGIYYKNKNQNQIQTAQYAQAQDFLNKYQIQKRVVLLQLQELYKLDQIYVKNQSYTKNSSKQALVSDKIICQQQQQQENGCGRQSQQAQQPQSKQSIKKPGPENKKQYFQFYLLKDFQFEITKQTYEAYDKIIKQIGAPISEYESGSGSGLDQITIQLNIISVQVQSRPFFNMEGTPKVMEQQSLEQSQQQKESRKFSKSVQIVYKYKNQIIGKVTENSPVSSFNNQIKILKGLKLPIDHKFMKLDLMKMQKTVRNKQFFLASDPSNTYQYRAIHRLSLNYQRYHKLHGRNMIKNYENMLKNLQINEKTQELLSIIGNIINSVNSLPKVSIQEIYSLLESMQIQMQMQIQNKNKMILPILSGLAPLIFVKSSRYNKYLQSQYQAQALLRKSQISTNKSLVNEKDNSNFSQNNGQQKLFDDSKSKQNILNKKSTLTLNIFDSEAQIGKFFDLTTKDIKQQNPSILFKGQLKKYQKLALAWMLHREQCPIQLDYGYANYQYEWESIPNASNLYINKKSSYIRPYLPINQKFVKGGILADEMGLGKTIMAVALIGTHFRKELSQKQLCKYQKGQEIKAGTLIIVPLTVLHQWKNVLEQYLPNLKCILFYGKNRNILYQQIVRSQIVLTTQSVLKYQRSRLKKHGSTINHGFSLYHYQWLRLIIDQAHTLRTQTSLAFNAARQIRAEYRWCLTGTPFQNKLEDIQSLLIFLQYQPWSKLPVWNEQFKQAEQIHTNQKMLQKLKSILKGVIIRRKKQSRDQNGNKLLQIFPHKSMRFDMHLTQKLYKKYQKISEAILNNVYNFENNYQKYNNKKPEQSIKVHDLLHKRKQLQKQINKLFMSTFEKLTKMRQFCSHPSLYESKSKYTNYLQFPKQFQKFLSSQSVSNKKSYFRHNKNNPLNSYINQQMGSYSKRKQLRKKLQNQTLDLIMEKKQFYCAVCSRQIKSKHVGMISICLHFYCQNCLKHEFSKSKRYDIQESQQQNQIKAQLIKFKLSNKYQNKKTSPQKAKNKKHQIITCPSPGCNAQLYRNQFLALPRLNRFGNIPIQQIKQHKKIQFILDYLKMAKSQEKVIVFTSFIGMIQLVAEALKRQNILHMTMMGNDSYETRSKRLRQFKQNPQIKVFVISLKCGYAGLNLQMANKVIFCETWWNPAVEDQAIARLHRMGQHKQVQVIRLITKNTIQEQMFIVNQQKKLKSDFILDSDTQEGSKRSKRLIKVLQIKKLLLQSLKQLELIFKQKEQNKSKNKKNKNKNNQSNCSNKNQSQQQPYQNQDSSNSQSQQSSQLSSQSQSQCQDERKF